MKEKEAKENQGVRDASPIYRVLAGAVRDASPIFPAPVGAVRDANPIGLVSTGAVSTFRPLTVLCDPLYKCAGRLWVLMGWGRSVMRRVWGLNDLHTIY